MGALPKHRLTVEEYVELDRDAEIKSEYHDGEMFPMVAVTFAHGQIVGRLGRALPLDSAKKRCTLVHAVRIEATSTHFVYPDIALICGKPVTSVGRNETVTNPKAIFEVLSPSTADYDRAGKFDLYQRIPSFEEYFLVAQDEPKITVFHKQSARIWTMEIVTGMDGTLPVRTLEAEVPMAAIYDGVEFVPYNSVDESTRVSRQRRGGSGSSSKRAKTASAK